MDIRDYLSDDGQVLLALCSAFGKPESAPGNSGAPFTLSEWNQLARQIHNSSWKRPVELQGRSSGEIAKALAIPSDQAERIGSLLDRSGHLILELEGLFSRGMWVLTRVDEKYPVRLRNSLMHQAPTVLFGSGELRLLDRDGVAVVGSRNIDESGAAFAKEVGRKAVAAGLSVISGGARGTDRLAMDGAMEASGTAIGVLADSLEATIRKSDVRELLLDGRLVLLTAYAPTAGFSVGAAMGRNKFIYGLANSAVVVSSDFQTGGTWAGAVEALKGGWCPVFVRQGAEPSKGNLELIKKGGIPLPETELESIGNLSDWMDDRGRSTPVEQELFDAPINPRRSV